MKANIIIDTELNSFTLKNIEIPTYLLEKTSVETFNRDINDWIRDEFISVQYDLPYKNPQYVIDEIEKAKNPDQEIEDTPENRFDMVSELVKRNLITGVEEKGKDFELRKADLIKRDDPSNYYFDYKPKDDVRMTTEGYIIVLKDYWDDQKCWEYVNHFPKFMYDNGFIEELDRGLFKYKSDDMKEAKQKLIDIGLIENIEMSKLTDPYNVGVENDIENPFDVKNDDDNCDVFEENKTSEDGNPFEEEEMESEI